MSGWRARKTLVQFLGEACLAKDMGELNVAAGCALQALQRPSRIRSWATRREPSEVAQTSVLAESLLDPS